MPDRINPRPIFRRAIKALSDARCPECGLTLVPWGTQDSNHCAWCMQRQILVGEYRDWYRQDQEAISRRRK